ncbi:hypothetical protein NAC44_17395 [Allorhizobium sp. BGMRC 0089]|uniref:hypothetical protein n=1 Tax=Allorhizobium sonneratiae TaxID=2934936 RepID=UPI0020348D70|nr:hypothetical protein [Allorhizobium sonneratiae]MCM2294105.1 hypothetical protein [Allorhizobium sonneratiae]
MRAELSARGMKTGFPQFSQPAIAPLGKGLTRHHENSNDVEKLFVRLAKCLAMK